MRERAYEDLAMIRRLMEESRRDIGERGHHFVIWGVGVAVGLLATEGAVAGRWAVDPASVWVGVLVVGWLASMIVGWRGGRSGGVRTAGRRLLTGVWVSVAVTLTLVGVAGLFGEVVTDRALPGLLSVVLASPVFLTAVLTGERWLVGVAAAWWVGGGVMLFVPGSYVLLLMAAMAVLLLAVPGAVLNVRSGRPREPRVEPGA